MSKQKQSDRRKTITPNDYLEMKEADKTLIRALCHAQGINWEQVNKIKVLPWGAVEYTFIVEVPR